jgi:hypothetical protein
MHCCYDFTLVWLATDSVVYFQTKVKSRVAQEDNTIKPPAVCDGRSGRRMWICFKLLRQL